MIMRFILLLLAVVVLVATACDPSTPPVSTPTIVPSPTPEEIDDDEGFHFYRVVSAVVLRAGPESNSAVLLTLPVGETLIAYDPERQTEDGIWRVWVLNNCAETLASSGYAARNNGKIWLQEIEACPP